MLLDGDGWREVFDTYERDAWRFEAQPVYTMPNETENISRFLRGEPKPSNHNERWHQRVRGYKAAGRTVGRVRIVRQPLTDYQRYQFAWGIPGNIEAGEDIRVLDATRSDYGLPLTGRDWWLFDDSRVVNLNFRPDGTQISRELVESPNLAQHLRWRDVAMTNSVPFAEYLKENG
ncbi:hypothetical protein EDD99_0879 [Streptomyces sp. 846.5]|nr:DUF6879 family protein [Streptomyces sp. 846.5]TDU02486.1 hypothetical protein EDD99_0879 [Streptomyces sp. 846.5]